jgi:hypothetical protein
VNEKKKDVRKNNVEWRKKQEYINKKVKESKKDFLRIQEKAYQKD